MKQYFRNSMIAMFVIAAISAISLHSCSKDNDPQDAIAVTGVSLDKPTLTLDVGATATLTAAITPGNASNKAVGWTSGNTAVATVDNGTVTAVAAGEATITVTTADGSKTAQCAVTVKEADNPKPTINGVWERRVNGEVDIDITIAGDSARFTQVYSGDWKTCLEQGLIKLGDLKFKNMVAASDTTWTCEELWWSSSWGNYSISYEPATLTLRQDGVLVSLSKNSSSYYYRK
jgi:hypothetical protein